MSTCALGPPVETNCSAAGVWAKPRPRPRLACSCSGSCSVTVLPVDLSISSTLQQAASSSNARQRHRLPFFELRPTVPAQRLRRGCSRHGRQACRPDGCPAGCPQEVPCQVLGSKRAGARAALVLGAQQAVHIRTAHVPAGSGGRQWGRRAWARKVTCRGSGVPVSGSMGHVQQRGSRRATLDILGERSVGSGSAHTHWQSCRNSRASSGGAATAAPSPAAASAASSCCVAACSAAVACGPRYCCSCGWELNCRILRATYACSSCLLSLSDDEAGNVCFQGMF